ncbi:hypothetical protein FRC03_004734 [Tulasnella sp. 419]|nr:hypothetical protein FRC03_004734 [Tulasnella sp. 419]
MTFWSHESHLVGSPFNPFNIRETNLSNGVPPEPEQGKRDEVSSHPMAYLEACNNVGHVQFVVISSNNNAPVTFSQAAYERRQETAILHQVRTMPCSAPPPRRIDMTVLGLEIGHMLVLSRWRL